MQIISFVLPFLIRFFTTLNGILVQQSHDEEWQRYNGGLPDGGPVYAETDLSRFIVEPWNAASSLLIVVPAIYMIVKLWGRFRQFPFLSYCIPLLILGGMGSTIFHAFRASPFFLVMDILPTFILTLSIGIYFWVKVLPQWWQMFFIVIPGIMINFLLFNLDIFSSHTTINVSYGLRGIIVFLPALILLYQTKMAKSGFLIGAIALFILSLIFREWDAHTFSFLPMGTHFLWHAFSGLGAFFLAEYLYFVSYFRREQRLSESSFAVYSER